jgi:gluconolactonase
MNVCETAEEVDRNMSDWFEIVDEDFQRVLAPDSELSCIADGFEFTEGPTWYQGGLVFSDIPADTIYRWEEGSGHFVWRRPSHHANGNTVDGEGRLVTCEHGSRRLTRTEQDGSIAILAASHRGKRLNSPNDVVVRGDGTIWFTDPPYGIRPEEVGQSANHVFCLRPGAGELTPVASDFSMPNGLTFGPDEQVLYIADSDPSIHHIRRFGLTREGGLAGGEVFATIETGAPDGLRVDAAGRLYSTAGDGVHVFGPQGNLLGKIKTPEAAANCAFGGPEMRTLFITAGTAVWATRLAVSGR